MATTRRLTDDERAATRSALIVAAANSGTFLPGKDAPRAMRRAALDCLTDAVLGALDESPAGDAPGGTTEVPAGHRPMREQIGRLRERMYNCERGNDANYKATEAELSALQSRLDRYCKRVQTLEGQPTRFTESEAAAAGEAASRAFDPAILTVEDLLHQSEEGGRSLERDRILELVTEHGKRFSVTPCMLDALRRKIEAVPE